MKKVSKIFYVVALCLLLLLSGCGGGGSSDSGASSAEITDDFARSVIELAIFNQLSEIGSSPYPSGYQPTQPEIECVKAPPAGGGWQPVIACLDNN